MEYRDSGVDIDAASDALAGVKAAIGRTWGPEIASEVGSFGGLFRQPDGSYLVSSIDGVGTKLLVGLAADHVDGVGADLVNHCVNDILVQGARPLFFLDYFAAGVLDGEVFGRVVRGMAEACAENGCALIGGETAEMPGMYEGEDYDLAGFCVGVVERAKIIDGSRVQPGDALIALPSSGPHSNGYSLIRKVLEVTGADTAEPCGNVSLGEALLAPTTIYNRPLLAVQKIVDIKAMAHITGGGILENLPRVLPANLGAEIQRDSWQLPPVFQWLQAGGNIEDTEMMRTFNCGIGMILVVDQASASSTLEALAAQGVTGWELGRISDEAAGVQFR